ncbi:putative ribosomal protein L5 [Schistosoma mansoni]|uniref:putative ribosomal protein L5 n=1 Tax=Schistosoma mansoni TaxID=6183 RepID=UPI00022DC7BC|nr:putative ribosomal protein L5 [Schistosoma mansoni]|eukprot:XP_018648425.1 putative ribosomal protein L5 [Schistosoma mansoni]
MIIYIFCLALLCEKVSAWDSGELQMFDLVEEVKENFYDFLGVSQTADISEIKRAYRKLSSKLHPDKNPDDPTAEQKFRRLVGIYEVLKNPELRAKYDEVLINGLPSWRTPVFYFRKLRKMSNYELFGLFFGMATVIHYAALWGSVFEKRLTLEDQLSTSLKRHKARDRKLELINQEISDELQKIPGPGWFDLLPFAIVRWIYAIITFIPVFTEFINGKISEKLQERRELREEARTNSDLQLLLFYFSPSIITFDRFNFYRFKCCLIFLLFKFFSTNIWFINYNNVLFVLINVYEVVSLNVVLHLIRLIDYYFVQNQSLHKNYLHFFSRNRHQFFTHRFRFTNNIRNTTTKRFCDTFPSSRNTSGISNNSTN